MGQDDVVGRAAARAAALQQRRMEPAAMLVGAFEIHHLIGTAIDLARHLQIVPLLEREGVRAAGIEPHVENVVDLVEILDLVAAGSEEARAVILIPGVRALLLERIGDGRVDALVLEDFAGAAADENGDRHAPGALARHDPVGPVLDHAGDAVLAGLRHPLDRLDRMERALPKGVALIVERLVHGDEPLRRIAEQERRLGTPGMRILVLETSARDQRADFVHLTDHRLVGAAILALVVVDAFAGKERDVGKIGGIRRHRMRHLRRAAGLEHRLVLDEGVVVVRAMAGRRMHEARSGIVRHVIGGQHRDGEIPIAIRARRAPERMRRALDHDRQHILDALVGGDARGREHIRRELVGQHVTIADLCPVVVGRSRSLRRGRRRCSRHRRWRGWPGSSTGVVVQITTDAPSRSPSMVLVIGNFTQIVLDVFS